jgi:hypothetical protein
MLRVYRETMVVYCKNHMENIIAPCEENAAFSNITEGGKHRYPQDLKG